MKVNKVFPSVSLNMLKWWRIINHSNAEKSKTMKYSTWLGVIAVNYVLSLNATW